MQGIIDIEDYFKRMSEKGVILLGGVKLDRQ